MIYSLIINNKNIDTIEWFDNYFRYCLFENFLCEGKYITSDFSDCTFNKIEWYLGIFNCINFIGCEFNECLFLGSSFLSCRFVECQFNHCQFKKDNMGGECMFDDSIMYIKDSRKLTDIIKK